MEKSLRVLGLGGVIFGMLLAAGCGGGGSDGFTSPGGKTIIPPPGPTQQDTTVSTGGNDDAARANVTYHLQAGDYTYTISNFAPGDKLVFPAGNLPSVDNSSFTDGTVKLSCSTAAGSVVTVQLLKLNAVQDKVVSVYDINNIYGAGTITQQ